MDCSRIPTTIRLSDVSAKKSDNENGMVICGKLQLDSSLSTALESNDKCLKVHVEVNIKEKVERVFGTPTEKLFDILLHGKSYTKSVESTLLQKEYVVGDDHIVNDGDISFRFPWSKSLRAGNQAALARCNIVKVTTVAKGHLM